LKQRDIMSVFHYLSLHRSPYYQERHDGRELCHADRYTDCLLRLPMFADLTNDDVQLICQTIHCYYRR
ncbi:MAG: DegT/DnrJ/EryC1/StrS family aminotransferase, partial [Chloroflexi bacterium]|nr:DegT/DnrJ/EryC1/StrS family aminotransferase [Chloroflexota bacterium]